MKRGSRTGWQRDARTLHRALVDMLPRVVQESRLLDVWSANCGRNTAYHSGYLRFLGRIGLLQRVDGPGAAGGLLVLGQLGNRYCVDRKGSPGTLKALGAFIAAADALRTCQQLPRVSQLVEAHFLLVHVALHVARPCSHRIWVINPAAAVCATEASHVPAVGGVHAAADHGVGSLRGHPGQQHGQLHHLVARSHGACVPNPESAQTHSPPCQSRA